jgi:peptidoglycan/xylan/chitin deacetylase (PgdA/CDA1 family)
MIFVLLLTSCSILKTPETVSSVSTVRGPSSSDDEENLNISFAILMTSENPEKEFSEYLDRLKSMYMRAEAYLSDFDGELDETLSTSTQMALDSSKSYKKLIVMWELSHRLKDKIVFHYLKLTDMAYDKSFDVEKRKLAKSILRKFKAKLDSNDPMEKIAFDEIKVNIATAIKERRKFNRNAANPADLPANNFKDNKEKLAVLRQYRANIRNIGKNEIEINDEINQQIESSSEKMKLIEQSGREPQSEPKFFASTGPNGNVMGLVFPKNVWALTFDDGPNPKHTPTILENLEKSGVKATFFWLAENVVRYQSVVDLVGQKGMTRANHSWSHPQLPKLDAAGLQKEIVQSSQIESKSFGEKVKFFRCPYGAGNSVPRIRQMIADLDMIHVFWNVDSLDWQDKDPDSIVARVKKQMQANGRGVVLFHDIHPQSVAASKKLVEWSNTLKGTDNAIRWVTLPEIVDEMNGR